MRASRSRRSCAGGASVSRAETRAFSGKAVSDPAVPAQPAIPVAVVPAAAGEPRRVVHAFGFPMAYYAVLLGRLAGLPQNCLRRAGLGRLEALRHLQPAGPRLLETGRARRRRRRGGAAFRGVAAGMDPRRLMTIFDGVIRTNRRLPASAADIRREFGLDPDRLTVGMIARLDLAKKGQDIFLRAIPAIHHGAPGAHSSSWATGRTATDRSAGGRPAGRLEAGDGRSAMDLADLLMALDVLVIPSRWESVPKVLLEGDVARAAGRGGARGRHP